MELEQHSHRNRSSIVWNEKMLAYEQRLRELKRRRVRAVRYCEIDYQTGSGAWSDHPDFDSLDFGLTLELEDGGQFSIEWGASFTQYGLSFEHYEHTDSQKIWDVSSNSRWSPLLGVDISATRLFWCDTEFEFEAEEERRYYPQDLEFTFVNGQQIYISALEIREGNLVLRSMDHITVFFDQEVALKYHIGPWGAG